MANLRQVKVSGTGMYVPPKIVTNHDLEKMQMDTTDEWIVQRTGIKERRYVEEGIGPSDLALEASKKALAAAKLDAKDIDLIVFATLSPDYYFPGSSVFLQDKLGLTTTPAMDIRCQCTGFIYALNTAQAFISSGQYDRVLVVGAEVHSAALDFTTRGRDVAVIFGDGAGAVVLEPSDEPERGLIGFQLHTQGQFRDVLNMKIPSTLQKPYIKPGDVESGAIYPYMEGRHVFKHAVTRMPEAVCDLLGKHHLKPGDVDKFIFHQANLRINETVLKQLDQPMSKSYNNIQNYGNCSAASVPMCLAEAIEKGEIKRGDLVCMAAFGAGFTWGAALLRI